MDRQKILIADDDPEILSILQMLLKSEGYEVLQASDGAGVLRQLADTVGLVILDVMMPGMDGYSVCAQIRRSSQVPVLFLTAKSQDSDKTLGFSLGGDDYLVKPFSYSELISRVKALLRRYYVYGGGQAQTGGVICCCQTVEIDPQRCLVRQKGKEVSLTETEYKILLLLASHRKKVFSIQNIYESIWEEPYFYTCNNTVMVHIRNIRRKLGDDPQNSRTIRTVWGKGYLID